ncbi:C40 family peptidase [Streptosporangium sp. KLBMP 9127]|nr:C40 family peptidase [Streptosporangium sp. KLBMP 9127]
MTDHTTTLATTVRDVDAAWQGTSADAFHTYMGAYTTAADGLSDALTTCATSLDAAADALEDAKTRIQEIIDDVEGEARTYTTSYHRENPDSDQEDLDAGLQRIVEQGITDAQPHLDTATTAVADATTTLADLGADYTTGRGTFAAIEAASGQPFVPESGRTLDWQPTPDYQGSPTDTHNSSYNGTPGATSDGGGYGTSGAGGTALPYVTGTGTGADIVEAAKQHFDKPYIWGANGPSAFDCSGLVYYALNQAGIEIGDTTAAGYQASGQPISGPPQPGDIVFFGDPPTHCGIYVGDGKMINAPHSGAVVRVDEVAGGSQPITYRRFA